MMMRMVSVLAMVLALMAATGTARAAGSDGIAAVVNDQPISMSEVAERMKLLIISSGMKESPEVYEKMRPQVINILIDETIRLQETDAQKVAVEENAIDAAFADVAKQNNMEPAQFSEILKRSRVSEKSLRQQLKSQIAWNRLVEQKLMSEVEVSEFDVDAMEQQLKANIGKTEYLAAEIFLPVDTPADEPDVRALAERLVSQLKAGGVRFSALAGQFSQAAGASRGGDMGWVQEGQLPPELDGALRSLQKGEITAPVRTMTGYHILLLRDQRQAMSETIPSREEIFNRLGMINLDRVQRRHFMNLKAAAFIDRRDS